MNYQWNWTTLSSFSHEVFKAENIIDLDIRILSQKETIISLMFLIILFHQSLGGSCKDACHSDGSLPLHQT